MRLLKQRYPLWQSLPASLPLVCTRGRCWEGIATAACLFLLFGNIGATESVWAAQQNEATNRETSTARQSQNADNILNLDLEQLAKTPVVVPSMDIPVTSVTKEQSTVGRSAAAVFVITNEMIRRSGATCIPEALRMAPGLDVAQINANAWAISCRGFNSAYSNKLLVLIDGRSVYNPDFSGVYWNMQDVLLEDVDRIEVVRGPGGTLWGSNAVNGVINVITKSAKNTQGLYVTGGLGSQQTTSDAFRYGGSVGDDLQYRVYGKYFEYAPNYDPTTPAEDAWRQGRYGFRADWSPGRDKTDVLTIQGDHFLGTTDNGLIPTNFTLGEYQAGENLLMRWRHVFSEDSDWTLQTYYDSFSRSSTEQTETVKTFDVDCQYRFRPMDRHTVTCGADFRNVESYYAGGDSFTTWYPYPYFTTNYASQFVQDEMTVVEDRLAFTLGIKLEENPYTGLEYQPNARLLWTPDRQHSGWGAISRAVRTPSRYQDQVTLTLPAIAPDVYPRVFGQSDTVSENVLAYELGFREQATERFSWDIAGFYNAYDHLIYAAPALAMPTYPIIIPLFLENGPSGQTYGVELSGNYAVTDRWRLYAQYTVFQMHIDEMTSGTVESGNDPCNQVYLRSAWNLSEKMEFDLMARYIDRLITLEVPSYITMDLRLAWRPRQHLEMALVGQNLLQAHHWEFAGDSVKSPAYATEVCRGVYGTFTWRY
jgi:iron complex outermembrane recepter protein